MASSRSFNRSTAAQALLLLGLAVLAWLFMRLQSDPWWQAWPLPTRWLWATLSVLAYLVFCAGMLRGRRSERLAALSSQPALPDVLVAYASQTGFAWELAQRTHENLRSSGVASQLLPIEQLDLATLQASTRVLFVVSTTGEGDPPDHALGFVRNVMAKATALPQLRYAILALGDRAYNHFCGFGHQLDRWLREHAARPLFDLVEVDNAEDGALRHWQHHLGLLGAATELPDWTPAKYTHWKLHSRQLANPGSEHPAFHVELRPAQDDAPSWQAGDIAEIGPRHAPEQISRLLASVNLSESETVRAGNESVRLADLLAAAHLPSVEEISGKTAQAIADHIRPLPHREYSIASLPTDGSVQLLVRQMLRSDGTPGLGSGWLCTHAPIGGNIAMRIRSNPNFHPASDQHPLILIANGTGIAGLRAHLKARAYIGASRNWLLFGERFASTDNFYAQELTQWHRDGLLTRMDLAFSREQSSRIYVQQLLANAEAELRSWVEDGASILVCGSLQGMAPSVDSAIRHALGDEQVEELMAQGRYRRDVY